MGSSYASRGIQWTEALVGVRFPWTGFVVWFGFTLIVPNFPHSCPPESRFLVSQWFCELSDTLFIKSCLLNSEWFLVLKTLLYLPFSYLPHFVSYHSSPWFFLSFSQLDFMLTGTPTNLGSYLVLKGMKASVTLFCNILYYQPGCEGLKTTVWIRSLSSVGWGLTEGPLSLTPHSVFGVLHKCNVCFNLKEPL